MKEYKFINYKGYTFACEITKSGKPGRLEKDLNTVIGIMDKGIENLTHTDKLALLNVYNVAYHESGKIEGIFSLDSSASNCTFCKQMREYADKHPEKKIVCKECYDAKQEKFKINALARHTLNLLIMETVDFSVDELATLSAYGLIRVNSSGDASNNQYACNMIKFAIAHSESNVTIWSKNTSAYRYACDTYGKPGNVTLIQSSLYIDKPCKLAKYFDYTFTVYMDENEIMKALAHGACECNGKKCKACGNKCYLKAWKKGSDIAELLRK
jgi:hypothetical protein